ncbi:hypothetical protein KY289_028333 [Solanum tuberosum]|nr:hypothetical protein KY289_028333 [Solanum tuberosum]
MESWLLILILILILSLIITFCITIKSNQQKKFPPGPFAFSVITGLLRVNVDIELILRDLKTIYGPIFNLRIGIGFRRPSIFVASHSLAYQALVQQGAVFSDRPKAAQTSLRSDSAATEGIRLIDHFRYAMFYLLVLMCFGENIDEAQVKLIHDVQRRWMQSAGRFINLSFIPRSLQKIIYRKQWKELIQLIQDQESVFMPLIEARMKAKTEEDVVAYADTLLNLEFPEKKRKFNRGEIVSLCSEFLSAGTDTTATSLQWIMANLVKYPSIQEKLYQEIYEVMSRENSKPDGLKEEDLEKMPYLKAVILEGLRRHPPGHFLQPHTVTELNSTIMSSLRM